MLTLAFILVVCSGLVNAIWNLFAKLSLNKAVFLWLLHVIAGIMYMPFFIHEMATKDIALTGLGMMSLSMVFHGLYMFLLAKVYAMGDMSQVYPIMRGAAALLIPLFGVSFFSEQLSWMGWVGICSILIGIYLIGNWKGFIHRGQANANASSQAVWVALVIGLCITAYTLTDKITLQYMSPLALIQASHFGYIISLSLKALRSKQIKREWVENWRNIVLGSILAPGGYLLFLYAMDMGQIAQLAPIREIGIVFGAWLGIFILKEKKGMRRIIVSVAITMGVILIKSSA